MTDSIVFAPGLEAIRGKPVQAAFDGGLLSSDGGALLLAAAERRLRLADRLAACLPDGRDPARIDHSLAEMLRFRMLAIACGYPDADDCDLLRHDPAFKLAVGRLPESGAALCSQPTVSRLENAPSRFALGRMIVALIDLFCDRFPQPPRRITLDIDDTPDAVHGGQQLALFNAHYDMRCFQPVHVYHAETGRPLLVLLRPGKTPDGKEVRRLIRFLVIRLRRRWPAVEITLRGDSHYGRPEAMAWCEANRVFYLFGLAGNPVLEKQVAALGEAAALDRLARPNPNGKARRFGDFRYAAGSWHRERRVVARIEASDQGVDARFVVTNLPGRPRWLYETVYCARGAAENLIKAHKRHLASDRTSCSKATANQFRLLLHTAAYWLMQTLREAAPQASFWRRAQFDTLRAGLLKIAVRVRELATRIKLSLPTACPDQKAFVEIAGRLAASP